MRFRGLTTGVVSLLAAAGLAACGEDVAQTAGAAVRDSAGVRIVEYAGMPEHEAPFALSPEPVFRHGLGPGDYLFGNIRGGALFPGGRAAVYDAGNSEIVVLSPDGTGHELLARSGEDPGEIGYVLSMFAVGMDSLLVEDAGNARFTLFGSGAVVRSVSLEENRQFSRSFSSHGIDAFGHLLMSSSSYRRGFPED